MSQGAVVHRELVEVLAARRGEAPVVEIAAALGIARSTAQNRVRAAARSGLVRLEERAARWPRHRQLFAVLLVLPPSSSV